MAKECHLSFNHKKLKLVISRWVDSGVLSIQTKNPNRWTLFNRYPATKRNREITLRDMLGTDRIAHDYPSKTHARGSTLWLPGDGPRGYQVNMAKVERKNYARRLISLWPGREVPEQTWEWKEEYASHGSEQ